MYAVDSLVQHAHDLELEQFAIAVEQERKRRAMLSGRGGNSPSAAAGAGLRIRNAEADAPEASAPFEPRGLTLENVEDAFRSHSWDHAQIDASNQMRDALVTAAKVILRVVPSGPDRSAALRKLREARMDANSAITFNGRF